jgi:hypothetical protein
MAASISPRRPLQRKTPKSLKNTHPVLHILCHPPLRRVYACWLPHNFCRRRASEREEKSRRISGGRPVEYPGGTWVDSREPYAILSFWDPGNCTSFRGWAIPSVRSLKDHLPFSFNLNSRYY